MGYQNKCYIWKKATLSCNGDGCKPLSIRKWIRGPTSDVLCFNDYCSNPAKYLLMYNETKLSFDLMIKSFNFTDTNCTYTCACGFHQYTHMLNLDEIDFIYPPDTDLISRTIKEDEYCFTRKYNYCQRGGWEKLYELKLEYNLSLGDTNCRENVTVSCKVKSLDFSLFQTEVDLCKGNKSG
ncbi:unnamed protein product [Mytilus edulis]|uniref:Uncharacterized protein n=1 Tax=Mytilus edulis TaxID=6550 RepID=A0A8S3QMS0_MYTED|nr:unnamed protein product [Mytilus edulis]